MVTTDRFVTSLLCQEPSYSAKAEYPVRRSFSIPSLTPRNTGSPAFAGDDGRGCGAFVFIRRSFTISRRQAPESCIKSLAQESEGVGNAGCPLHPQPRVRDDHDTPLVSGKFGRMCERAVGWQPPVAGTEPATPKGDRACTRARDSSGVFLNPSCKGFEPVPRKEGSG
jgi:hypothetical protein